MNKEINISYGALSDLLEEQVNRQGFTLGESKSLLQELYDSMLMCWILGICTDSQKDAMIKKMHKKILKALKPLQCKECEEDE